jgi:hypothetical protein
LGTTSAGDIGGHKPAAPKPTAIDDCKTTADKCTWKLCQVTANKDTAHCKKTWCDANKSSPGCWNPDDKKSVCQYGTTCT